MIVAIVIIQTCSTNEEQRYKGEEEVKDQGLGHRFIVKYIRMIIFDHLWVHYVHINWKLMKETKN